MTSLYARAVPAYKYSPQPGEVSSKLQNMFGSFLGDSGAVRLNVGCAKNLEPGFINLDMQSDVGAQVVWDLEYLPLPFSRDSVDCIFASHVLEHIKGFLPLIYDFHRILKPGGCLIAITPHGASDDAWDSPHHVAHFSGNTWLYIEDSLYDISNHSGYGARQNHKYGNWRREGVYLIPYPEFVNDPQLDFKCRHFRNIIQEVHAIFRKVE